MQAACVPAWRLQYELTQPSYARMQAAYERMKPAYRRNASCILHYAGMHAAACCTTLVCRLLQPAYAVCRLQPESLGCIRLHFEKCTWLVATRKCFNTWVSVSMPAPVSIAILYCFCCYCVTLCAKFINKIKITKCCSRPDGRHGVRHGLDWPPHADCSSDLRGERCNFVTMSNSYRIGAY